MSQPEAPLAPWSCPIPGLGSTPGQWQGIEMNAANGERERMRGCRS